MHRLVDAGVEARIGRLRRDLCLIVYLRRRRARNVRQDRMSRSLELHLRRELAADSILAPRTRLRYLR